jgi:hypothetical protein
MAIHNGQGLHPVNLGENVQQLQNWRASPIALRRLSRSAQQSLPCSKTTLAALSATGRTTNQLTQRIDGMIMLLPSGA